MLKLKLLTLSYLLTLLISDEQLNPELTSETDTSGILGTESVLSDTALLPKDGHTICCQELELSNGLSVFTFSEGSAIFQYVSVSGPGPCQQRVNESTSMTAAEASMLPVPDEQLKNNLEGNEVDEHSCGYDTEFLKREASNLHRDDCMDLCSEANHQYDLPTPRCLQQSSYFQENNDLGSLGICQSSKQRSINELDVKRHSFKVSSSVKGRYIAKSGPRLKPGDSLLRRNKGNTTTARPNADRSVMKDSSRRRQKKINTRPWDSLSKSGIVLHRNGKDTIGAVKRKANKPWL